MNIVINNKLIQSINISSCETAWPIADAVYVLAYYEKRGHVILGGDILNSDLVYNYDSWYYTPVDSRSHNENVASSIATAKKYISDYIDKNGVNYYMVLVVG